MANTTIIEVPGPQREKDPRNISVFWAFVVMVAAAAILVILMPAPSENAHVGVRYPSGALPDVYIRAAADRRISDTRRVKVSE